MLSNFHVICIKFKLGIQPGCAAINLSGMLASHAFAFHERSESRELLLEDPVSEIDIDAEAQLSPKVLYRASFEELARNCVQCDTIIWVLISLLLVLAWGVGLIMLLYLPVRRYVLQKDISSRKLYVTPNEIVYKVCYLYLCTVFTV